MDATTALTIAIPQEFHDRINAIRSRKDKAYPRWRPHINLLFPFVPEHKFESIAARLQPVLQDFGEIQLDLSKVGFFRQGKGNITIHLLPADDSRLQLLFQTIRSRLSEVPVKQSQFRPHLTVAQDKFVKADEVVAELADYFTLDPMVVTINCVSMISREKDAPFVERLVINLITEDDL